MNAYYEHNSVRGTAAGRISCPNTTFGDKAIAFICAIVAFFTSSVAIKIEKATLSAVCFIGFFGIIGGMENRTVSFFWGIVLCLLATLVEFIILRSLTVKKARGIEDKNA